MKKTILPPPTINTLPLNLFPQPPASKVAQTLQANAAVSEVRKAINTWLYEA